jgi:hypothetical protein
MMKYLQRLLLLTGAVVVFFSCQKEYSKEIGTGTNGGVAQWEFKDSASNLYKGPVDTAFIDTFASLKILTIEGHSTDGRDMLTLQVFAVDIKPGTYATPSSSIDYARNGSTIFKSNNAAIGDFTVAITAIDSFTVSGTFGGKVQNAGGGPTTLREGKFTARFKKGTTNPPPAVLDSGQVMLWSKAGCGGGASTTPIAVSISGKNGQITSFTATEPAACGAAGTYTTKLAVGSYTWKAKCGVDSISGSVTVTKNACTKVEVNFSAPPPPPGDYFPTTANSTWNYELLASGSPADSMSVLSTGTSKTYAPNTFSIFRNDYGPFGADSSYYRKTGGSYYEYYPAERNFLEFTTPTAVEHIFLKDNVNPSTTWQTQYTGTVIVDINGTPTPINVTAQVRDTLSAKLTSLTVGTITYQDVLEVHSGYFYVLPAPYNLTEQAYGIKQWFAKGVGLIKYSEVYMFDGSTVTLNLKRSKVN